MRANRENGIALITALLVLLLISSIIIGFSYLVMTDQGMGGNTSQRQRAFYGAEAGMEKLTADINNLFAQNYAPTAGEVNNLATIANNPVIPGVSYIDPASGAAGSGYSIAFAKDGNGNPLAQTQSITSGPYQGLTGLVTPYQLTVISETATGSEVKLKRTVNTVGIPIFQFGVFSQTDLSFFAGPNFNFGGRVHTNGNLFLAEGNGNTLTLADKVTAVGEVVRTNLSNGFPTNANYTGVVDILTAPGNFRAMAQNEGSLQGTLGSPANGGWTNLSTGTYAGYIRDGDLFPPQYTGVNGTGARNLNLAIATPQLGGTPIDLIRRPVQGELAVAPGKLGTRYFSQASLRILISDNAIDITRLDCVSAGQPVDLSQMAQPVAAWPLVNPYTGIINKANAEAGGAGALLPPLAASGAGGGAYNANDGYWVKAGTPIITGYIKIEAQTTYAVPCVAGNYVDVTNEILGLGYAGRNLNPVAAIAPPTLPVLPGAQVNPSACADPNPNAVIRFERVRDNPSTRATAAGCGVAGAVFPPLPSDYWPNALFDPREANPRDWCPDGTGAIGVTCKQPPMLGGVMNYVELDVNNLVRWFRGNIGATGPLTRDPFISPNNFTVYFSDRRSNYVAAPLASGWPPASPSGNETGEYGWNDNVNSLTTNGCPDNTLNAGEAFDAPNDITLQTYGALAAQGPYPVAVPPNGVYTVQGLFNAMTAFSPGLPQLKANWAVCANPPYIATAPAVWPMWYVANNRNEARENPPLFFRRALKLVNGSTINLGACPSGVNCGLGIATENPVYVQGDYNAPGGAFVAPYGAASVVGDSFTFLSNSWNDVNSFTSTYDASSANNWRKVAVNGVNKTSYRLAIGAGKGISFGQPPNTDIDFGTDGGVHNFLRYIENWGGATLNYRGSIVSLYYNRQASGPYKCCTTVYTPPGRGYNFDTDFLTPNLLPPRTPMFRDVNTIGFSEYILPN